MQHTLNNEINSLSEAEIKGKTFYLRINDLRYHTKSLRRLRHKARTINWKIKPTVYLKVIYPYLKAQYECIPHNDGTYTDKKEFHKALEAFIE
jgi:hypothetical protein